MKDLNLDLGNDDIEKIMKDVKGKDGENDKKKEEDKKD